MPIWKFVGLSRGSGKPIVKPLWVVYYNKNMGGVDLSDQMIRSYTMHRRHSKWYIKLFFHLIALLVTNAYILHRKFSAKKLTHAKFRLSIVHDLVSSATTAPIPAPKGRRSVGQPLRRLEERHFPSPIPAFPGSKKQNPTRQCVVHRAYYKKHQDGKRPQESRVWCRKCEVALCTYPCFGIYHSRRHFDAVDPTDFNFDT
uniref:PiggyBac transposable element-derived protein 4-like n=1 Tax=Saccoglossus kowalevskii TaxID=10224 RepID=A0ABM0M9I2_SACKO|nr:PREDICTED: piggyBac transposable element-derived protein 4-like [Saccoglossus kowalevskii]